MINHPTRARLRLLSLTTFVGVLAGCTNQTPRPALMNDPTENNVRTLEVAASTLLAGPTIRFAPSAFTRNPMLSLTPAIATTPAGSNTTDSRRILPTQLQLLRVGRRCELMNLSSQERTALPGVVCTAI